MKKLIFVLFFIFSSTASANFKFLLETGAVWQNRNDVQIPTNTGDRLEFDAFNKGPFFHYRAEFFYNFKKNHNLRLLYAPFSVAVKGPISRSINFNNQTFSPGQDLEVNYTFNSYRLTYFYSFWGNKESQLNLGVTAKIRDAEIQFQQNNLSTTYDNLGFVPLIYFEFQTPLAKNWLFNFNMDAAAAAQGRAIDATAKIRYQTDSSFQLGLGYRTLEGGADNDKVFTFSWFNYAVVDIATEF